MVVGSWRRNWHANIIMMLLCLGSLWPHFFRSDATDVKNEKSQKKVIIQKLSPKLKRYCNEYSFNCWFFKCFIFYDNAWVELYSTYLAMKLINYVFEYSISMCLYSSRMQSSESSPQPGAQVSAVQRSAGATATKRPIHVFHRMELAFVAHQCEEVRMPWGCMPLPVESSKLLILRFLINTSALSCGWEKMGPSLTWWVSSHESRVMSS